LFQRGWHAPNLNTAQYHNKLAHQSGFELVTTHSLNAYLRLVPILSAVMYLCRLVYPHVEQIPLVTSTIGSVALQHLLRSGRVSYTYAVYRAQ